MCLHWKQRYIKLFLGFYSQDYTTSMCLSCPSWFVLSKLFLLCFLLGYPQKCGLPTFRNSNSDWGCTVLHTHIPEGARRGWKQEVVKFTPARVRTVIYPHQGQRQQMWQDIRRKEQGGNKEGRQHLLLCWHSSPQRNSYMDTVTYSPLRLFTCSLAFHSKHIYSTPYGYTSVRHSLHPLCPNASPSVRAESGATCFFSSLFIQGKLTRIPNVFHSL